MRSFVVAILVSLNSTAHCQTADTIYYTYKWEVCEKPFASYYRLGTVVADSVYRYEGPVRDFYLYGGGRQMEGAYNDQGHKDGTFKFYYPNGKLEADGKFANGLLYSFWNYYYPNGNKKAKIYYAGSGDTFIIIESFDSTGIAIVKDGTGKFEMSLVDIRDQMSYKIKGEFANGQRVGTWKYFNTTFHRESPDYDEIYQDGKLKKRNDYLDQVAEKMKNQTGLVLTMPIFVKFPITETFVVSGLKAVAGLKDLNQEVSGDTVYGNSRDSVGAYKNVEIEASYPGGERSWKKFLERTLRAEAGWDDMPKNFKSFTQTVWVQFIVCTDGTLCNIQTMNEVLPSLRKEAERVISLSGKWTPAVKNGRPVKAYRKQPITFSYSSD